MTSLLPAGPIREPGPRRRLPWIFFGVLALSLVPAAIYFWDDLPVVGGRGGTPETQGQVLWSTDRIAVQLGPAGWITHPAGGGDYAVTNVRTDESWTIGDLDSGRELTPDGVVVQGEEGGVLIQGKDSRLSTSATAIADAVGDKNLWPGEDIDPVGVSDDHVAVRTCLAPAPTRLHEEASGSRQVIAGIDLEDASVGWTHDTGVACGTATPAYYPKTLPAQEYLLVETADTEHHALDLDTGTVVRRWTGPARHDLTIHGDHVLEPAGEDTVVYRSLRTGKVEAKVECPGADAGDPQEISRQLSPEVTAFVECRDGVRLVDDGKVVDTTAAPASSMDAEVGETEVAVGPHLLRRTAKGVQLRDGLSGRTVADLDVPQGYEIGRFGPMGSLVAFVQLERGEARSTVDYRIFDARTGELVLAAGPGMNTGASMSPDGLVMVDLDEDHAEEDEPRVWVAGTKETS